MAGKTVGEKTRIKPAKVLDAIPRDVADVVVVVLGNDGNVKVHGSSGAEVSAWMLREAAKAVKPKRVA